MILSVCGKNKKFQKTTCQNFTNSVELSYTYNAYEKERKNLQMLKNKSHETVEVVRER